jgi:hypothetical protein
MRCNNHPSDGSVLGCGDFDLMLKTEIQNRILRRSFEICKKFKLHGTGINYCTVHFDTDLLKVKDVSTNFFVERQDFKILLYFRYENFFWLTIFHNVLQYVLKIKPKF